MDSVFRVPVIGTRIGWDSILGLVPVVGDVLTMAPAIYIVDAARRRGVPRSTLAHMGINIGIDAAIGAIPLLGDLIDIGWKANQRNVDLLEAHLARANEKGRPEDRPSTTI